MTAYDRDKQAIIAQILEQYDLTDRNPVAIAAVIVKVYDAAYAKATLTPQVNPLVS
jgi:hypothetical protein